MTATTAKPATAKKVSFGRGLMAGGLAIVLTIVANLLVRWIGMRILPVDPTFMPLATWQPTVIFTTLFLVVATVVFLVINAFASNPPRVFGIVALVALLISLIPDLMLLINPAAMPLGTPTLGAVLILITMHLVGYAIAVWAFTKWAQQG